MHKILAFSLFVVYDFSAMEKLIFFNGKFYPERSRLISVLDRGLCFGDGLFEVIRCIDGKFLLFSKHIQRMQGSAEFLEIKFTYDTKTLLDIARKLSGENGITNGELYIEITRGEAPRYHPYPKNTNPNFFMVLNPLRQMPEGCWDKGVKVITQPDIRWGYCHLKSINLLPNVLAKEKAKRACAYEAFLTRKDNVGDYLTECTSSSIFVVKKDVLYTPELDNILPGTTRAAVIEIAESLGILVKEKKVYLEECLEALEVFLTSTVSEVMPVVKIDANVISNGKPGILAVKIQSEYRNFIKEHLE